MRSKSKAIGGEPDAVNMMLPPLKSLPREGLVLFMASEPYLTAKRHLRDSSLLLSDKRI